MRELHEVLRLERPLIGLDLETTNSNPRKARVVELGLEIMKPGQPVKEYRTLVNPGEPIPEEATAVHHITDAMVQGCRHCGKSRDEHVPPLPGDGVIGDALTGSYPNPHIFAPWPTFKGLAFNLAAGLQGVDFAGYSVRYDLEVLAREFQLATVPWTYDGAGVIDGYRLKQITEPRTLADICKAEGVELLDAHSALADAKAATRAIASIISRHAFLPSDVAGLHNLCSPDYYDVDGKLRWKNNQLVMGFGEHRGELLRDVPRKYLCWIIKHDFSEKVKQVCRQALKGEYPNRVA